uniref:palmitoyl-CoA hydrolase n=1 Tax=Monodelphis domestica TaxID=13616 RepID=A0A5F8H9D6_MONDO
MLGFWGPQLPVLGVVLLLPLLPLLLPVAPTSPKVPYKPIIIVHGLFDSSSTFRHLLQYINQTHPGTLVTVLDLFDGGESLRPLWEQVQGFREAVTPIMKQSPHGVHLLCYSQGGLICRALLSVMDEHNVDTFISLSSPQMGQYGDTDYLKWLFPTSMRSNLYRVCYSPWGQEFSICNYWHDPHHPDLYLNASSFLALINGERDHPNATGEIQLLPLPQSSFPPLVPPLPLHISLFFQGFSPILSCLYLILAAKSTFPFFFLTWAVWRKNFLRVKRVILIGGPDDGVITPWQSRLEKVEGGSIWWAVGYPVVSGMEELPGGGEVTWYRKSERNSSHLGKKIHELP